MRISNYGIDLISMTEEDLDMVRVWRNRPDISEFMFFQNEITPEKQLEWFKSLDNTAIYLMIVYKGEKIGVINVKNINWRKRYGEAGIFIGDPTYRNSPVSMQAIFALMDAFFFDFKFKSLRATVKNTNENAIDFNERLGYEIESEVDDRVQMEVFLPLYSESRTKFTIVLEKYCVTPREVELTPTEKRFLR